MGDIVGIVLGTGSSGSLGRPKQTLPLRGITLLAWTLRDAEQSSLDEVVLVVRDDTEIAESYTATRAEVVIAGDTVGAGTASLQVGMDATKDADALVVLPGDMPGVDKDVIDQVVAYYCNDPAWAAITEYDDGLGFPFVFSAEAFDELRGLGAEEAVWKLVEDEPISKVRRVRVRQKLPVSIETWDDYREACSRFGFRPAPGTIPD